MNTAIDINPPITLTIDTIINVTEHPISDEKYTHQLRQRLDENGVITLPSFLLPNKHTKLLEEATEQKHKAYYTKSTHSVYLSPIDTTFPLDHAYNRQVTSSKGCITTDQIPSTSLLKSIYYNTEFQMFCAMVVGVDKLYPYADPLSEINVHYYNEGQELGWHFDNSSFAITLLLQKPIGGGQFEYIPHLRDSKNENNSYDQVAKVLDEERKGDILTIDPSMLVIFRGRDCLHRVTSVIGNKTRILVVFAYNDQPGVCLSKEARMTFFGRTGVD
jgi:hypothetical protein